MQEALEIARQIGRHRLLCGVLHTWGELYLRQLQWTEAAAAFGELRDIASGINQEYMAVASYGLARAAAGQGNYQEAQRLGQESFQLFETMGNRMAGQVRAWLEAQPGVTSDNSFHP